MKSLNRMYDEFAPLWPLVSAREDYENEAGYWRRALRAKLGPGRHEILELGVGGGNNLSYLTKDFKATAVDLSKDMLKQCCKQNPGVKLYQGDMRTVRLKKKFKAVIIHDAINYMVTEKDLRKTFATVVAHLKPGGIFITAPDHYKENFHPPFTDGGTNSNGKMEFTNLEYQWDPDPSDTKIESIMFFLIRTGKKLKIEQDHHLLGLFPMKTWLKLMDEAGFDVEKRPYPVHRDKREAWLLTGTLRDNR
jgi:SAM-dependent methyltransferase